MLKFQNTRQLIVLVLIAIVGLAGCDTPAPAAPTQIPTAEITRPAPTETKVPPKPTNTSTPPQPTATVAATEIPLSPDLLLEIDELLNAYVDATAFSGSILIARDGEILLNDGYGLADRDSDLPNTPQTKFRIASITKQFTAAAILLLQEQGALNVQDTICDYLDECPATWAGITIHHLLVHTSGIPEVTTLDGFKATEATPSAPIETLSRVIDMPLDFPSGEGWSYTNSGYIALGLIIEQVAGQSYEAFLQENIFAPLGMAGSGYDHNSDELAIGYRRHVEADYIDMSLPFAAGSLYSTVEDLYRWNNALHSEALLSQASLSQMFASHTPLSYDDETATGYGWVIVESDGLRMFVHDGWINGYNSRLSYYPDDELTIIILSNLESALLHNLHIKLFELVTEEAATSSR